MSKKKKKNKKLSGTIIIEKSFFDFPEQEFNPKCEILNEKPKPQKFPAGAFGYEHNFVEGEGVETRTKIISELKSRNNLLKLKMRLSQTEIDSNDKKLEALQRNEAPQPELPEGVKKADFLVPLALALLGMSALKKQENETKKGQVH